MKAVDYAIGQAQQDRDEERTRERDENDHKEKHSGSDAERRVSLIRNVLDKSDD